MEGVSNSSQPRIARNWTLDLRLLGIVAGLLFVWSAFPFLVRSVIDSPSEQHSAGVQWQSSGQWGDTFGAFNALIGATTAVLVFLTYKSQKLELKIAQQEIQQRDELIRKQTQLAALGSHAQIAAVLFEIERKIFLDGLRSLRVEHPMVFTDAFLDSTAERLDGLIRSFKTSEYHEGIRAAESVKSQIPMLKKLLTDLRSVHHATGRETGFHLI